MADLSDPSRAFGLPEGYFSQEEFSATDFIEQLSRVDLEFAKKNSALEPKPFIRTFERALEKLLGSQAELSSTISQLERSTKAYADDHRKKMARLKQTFVTVGSSFERLETQISEVGSNTIRIGEELDTVAKEKDRAEAIKELVGFYAELNEGNTARLDALLDGGSEGLMKIAHTLRRLNTVVIDNEYSAPSESTAKRQIEIYSENFEKMMLENFEHAYRDNDVHSMKTAARTLDAFNGGVSVVKAYINQHPFFVASMVNQAQDSIADASYASMQGISDINAPPPPPDRWLEQLYDDTRKMMFKDWTVISEVFPRPVEVMQQLLKRVFEQTIQSYLETLLGRAERQSKLAFLRVLASAHLATRKLIEDLQAFDAETITPAVTVLESARQSGNGMQGLLDMPSASQTAANEFSRRKTRKQPNKGRGGGADNSMEDEDEDEDEDEQDAGARARLGAAKSGLSSAMAIAALIGRGENENAASGLLHEFLNRCCDDLFESYVAGDNYINVERGHFRDAVRQALQPFVRAREERQTSARGNAFLGIFTSVPLGTANADKQQTESHGTVTVGTASFLLQIHAETVARAIELESAGAVSDAVAELFGVLISLIGDSYVFPALDDVAESLQDLRQEPDLRTFGVIRVSNVVTRLLQVHFERIVLPYVGTNSHLYRDLVGEKNHLMSRVETSLNFITNKLVSACVQWIASILNRQRRTDFKPAEDDAASFHMGTQSCNQCTDFLTHVTDACRDNMDRENRERVLGDIGSALYRMLIEHFKKFIISVSGGLVLLRDVARYRETIDRFQIPSLSDRFIVLQEISNIFVVSSNSLKSLLEDGTLAHVDRQTFQAFVQRREDYRLSPDVKRHVATL